MPSAPKPVPLKYCATCGDQIVRKRFNGRLEDRGVFLRRRYCSLACAKTKTEALTRDGYHARARKHRRAACEECGSTEKLHVHHSDRDISNNDPANLRTLCASCHLVLHWKEDRDKRLLATRGRRSVYECATCGARFPSRWRRQTCSPACKARLLSRRATENNAKKRASCEDHREAS